MSLSLYYYNVAWKGMPCQVNFRARLAHFLFPVTTLFTSHSLVILRLVTFDRLFQVVRRRLSGFADRFGFAGDSIQSILGYSQTLAQPQRINEDIEVLPE